MRMIKPWLLALFALVGTVNSAAQVVLGDDNYPPVSYLDAQGQPAGLLPRLLNALGDELHVSFEIRLYPWARAYSLAAAGGGGLLGVSENPQRRLLFDYTDPVYFDDIQIVVRKDRVFPFRRLADLSGKVLGGNVGASYGAEIDAALASGLFVVDRDASQISRLRKVLARRLDGALIGNGEVGLLAALHADPDLWAARDQLTTLERPLTRDPLYFAFPRSLQQGDLVAQINKALQRLKVSGALARLWDAEVRALAQR